MHFSILFIYTKYLSSIKLLPSTLAFLSGRSKAKDRCSALLLSLFSEERIGKLIVDSIVAGYAETFHYREGAIGP